MACGVCCHGTSRATKEPMPLPDSPNPMAPGSLLPPVPEDNLKALLFGFRGRLPRKAFWLYGVVGLSLAQLLAYALLGIAGASDRLPKD